MCECKEGCTNDFLMRSIFPLSSRLTASNWVRTCSSTSSAPLRKKTNDHGTKFTKQGTRRKKYKQLLQLRFVPFVIAWVAGGGFEREWFLATKTPFYSSASGFCRIQLDSSPIPTRLKTKALNAGVNMKAVFWLGIMFLTQISRWRFKQSRISLLISNIYVLGQFVNFLVIFRYIWR